MKQFTKKATIDTYRSMDKKQQNLVEWILIATDLQRDNTLDVLRDLWDEEEREKCE